MFWRIRIRNFRLSQFLKSPVIVPPPTFYFPVVIDALTKSFSAVCLLYAMELEPHLQRPIGLVETSWGGTPVEAWSSPDALSGCQNSRMKRYCVVMWETLLLSCQLFTLHMIAKGLFSIS